MIGERLEQIKRNIMDDVSPVMDELILLAMRQAVNEAIQECADTAYENVVADEIVNEIQNLKVI